MKIRKISAGEDSVNKELIFEDLIDVLLSAQIDGRKRSFFKYLKILSLRPKNIEITYIGEEAWQAEVRFILKDSKTGEYLLNKRGEYVEYSLTIPMGKPKIRVFQKL